MAGFSFTKSKIEPCAADDVDQLVGEESLELKALLANTDNNVEKIAVPLAKSKSDSKGTYKRMKNLSYDQLPDQLNNQLTTEQK